MISTATEPPNMADKTFRCRLITPTAQLLDEQVAYASVPAWDGLFGVLPGRAPIVAKLGLGELKLVFPDRGPDQGSARGGSRSFLVDDGFVQMVANKLTILASIAIPAETLTQADAQAEVNAVESRAAGKPADRAEMNKLTRDRRRARLKLHLASGSRRI